MSAALLKKSLELCDTPFSIVKRNDEVRYKAHSSDLKVKKSQRGVADVQRKNINSIEQVKKKRKQEIRKREIIKEKLLLLKNPVLDEKTAKKILESTKKRGASDREVIYLDKLPEEQSAFTEDDFEKFAREYQDDG